MKIGYFLLAVLALDVLSLKHIYELLAMLAIREGDMEQAKAEYEKIVNSANVQDSLKARAQDMVTIISDQSK